MEGSYAESADCVESIFCGVAVLMVLDGCIKGKGMLAPINKEMVAPLREELKKGWEWVWWRRRLYKHEDVVVMRLLDDMTLVECGFA